YWINEPHDPYFLKDGKQFLWVSERDGFRHLYLYSIDGREAKQVTKGSWEVRGIATVDEKAERIYYYSSEPSPIERHLYSVKLNGKDKKQLTSESGTHNISIAPGGAYYIDTWSSLNSPSRAMLHSGDGAELGTYREPDKRQADEYDILPTEIVKVKGAD